MLKIIGFLALVAGIIGLFSAIDMGQRQKRLSQKNIFVDDYAVLFFIIKFLSIVVITIGVFMIFI